MSVSRRGRPRVFFCSIIYTLLLLLVEFSQWHIWLHQCSWQIWMNVIKWHGDLIVTHFTEWLSFIKLEVNQGWMRVTFLFKEKVSKKKVTVHCTVCLLFSLWHLHLVSMLILCYKASPKYRQEIMRLASKLHETVMFNALYFAFILFYFNQCD